jgi:biotin carboxyl carrier protein
MKVKVRIDGHTYEVEVGDLNARPIVAVVAGEQYEIWPEEEQSSRPVPGSAAAGPGPAGNGAIKVVLAPLPGVIGTVAVQPGSEVVVGQELCTLEAMKMNNTIRSPRAGQIAVVHVSAGQHVQHHDVLVEYLP